MISFLIDFTGDIIFNIMASELFVYLPSMLLFVSGVLVLYSLRKI